jgi:glycine hydroxymethyltransferase
MVLCTEEFAATVDRGCPLVLGGPLGHIMAAKAVALTEASRPSFADYAHRIVDNATALADALQQQGATVLTGGTDNHLLLVDARPYGLTGRQAETALREAGITLNRNVIPFDPNGSWYTSGLRVGTPAVTTLGMGPGEMREIAAIVHTVLAATRAVPDSKAKYELDPSVGDQARSRAGDLLDRFPLYPGIAL